jgi:ankyrin repeat protein
MSTTLTGRDDIPEPVRALLPIAAFGQELESASSAPSSGTLTPFHHDATTLLLLGIGYAVMNNFPGNCNRKEIIQLLEKHLWQPLSKMTFRFLQEPTNRALLSGIFPLVVESGNVQFAETLLKTLRPNQIQDERPSLLDANTCMHKKLPIRLTPLQHACLSGRLDLADVLLRYGARIDDLEHAWPCSPLYLAIYGYKNPVWKVGEMSLLIRLITRLLDAGAICGWNP